MARAARILWIAAHSPDEAMRGALHDHGYTVLHLQPGADAPAARDRLRPDAIVLVLGTAPCDEHIATVRAWRARGDSGPALLVLMPVLRPIDEVLLLGAGADAVADVSQSTLLLLARLRGWLRRIGNPSAPITIGLLEVDAAQCRVRLDGRTLPLGPSACVLLNELALRAGGPASRTELARVLGPAGLAAGSRTVDMTICRLRRALQSQGVHDVAIESVRGRGYRIVCRAPGRALSRRKLL